MPADFYDLLGVDEDASAEEIRRAYRRLVREYHPDVNEHDRAQEQFTLVRQANEVLSDSAERKTYDRLGHREYVDQHLPAAPSLSVFDDGDEEGGRATESAAGSTQSSEDQTARSRGPGSSGRGHTHVGSTGDSGPTPGSSPEAASARTGRGSSADSTTTTSSRRGSRRRRDATTTDRSSSHRTALRRWYLLVGLSLATYLGGLGIYLRSNRADAVGLAAAVVGDASALLGPTGLVDPLSFSLEAATAGTVGVLFPVGAVVLAVVLVATVARFGNGWAYLYGVAGAAPLLTLGAGQFLPRMAIVDIVGLLLVPVLGVGAFLVDVGRYLLATR